MLKRVLKKRKRFTLQILVAFLIIGKIGYGEENIKNEIIVNNGVKITQEEINIDNKGTIFSIGEEGVGISKRSSSYSPIIESIKNSGIVSGTSTGNSKYSGNGILVELYNYTGETKLGTTVNSGIISGVSTGNSNESGNGIYVGASLANPLTSTIGDIKNDGIISGVSTGNSSDSGNGIISRFGSSNIGDIYNNGIISGISAQSSVFSGRGIYSKAFSNSNSVAKIGNILNYGVIFGNRNAIEADAQNGSDYIGKIINKGLIVGGLGDNNNSASAGYAILADNLDDIQNDGIISGENVGIAGVRNINKILNNGIIKGKRLISTSVSNIPLTNNGILAGENLYINAPYILSSGIIIRYNSNGNITDIVNGTGGEITLEDGNKKVVINSQRYDENGYETSNDSDAKDSYVSANGTNYENNIINGAGINKGALVVQAGTSISESIVNGYNTAVYLEDNAQLTATNTIFNGGGLKNDIAIIKGSIGDNVASILGTSIINGAIDLGDGNDTLSIANTVQINGELDGGSGNDILNLGEASITKATQNLNILHDITGFENINTNGNITLFETTKVTGANNINLESGNVILRVDPTVTVDGKVTGHALYGNNGMLTSNGGNLVIGLNGLGEGAIISMGGTTITPDTNDNWWKDTDHIKTNSLVLDGKLSEDGKDINITVLESIPLAPSIPIPPIDPQPPINPPVDPPAKPEPPLNPPVDPPVNPQPPITIDSLLYEKLNKIYQSIVSAGEIGNLANTTLLEDKTYTESLGGLLTILDQMYANNPYTYTVKSSRDSLKLFEDNISYLTIKPKKDEMIVQGKAIYTGVKSDSGAYGKNYYGFDTGHRNYKTTTNTVGGLATFEYGLSDKTSVGFVLGGNNQDINFKGSSKIKGNSLYLGAFTKTDINNFKFMGGVGYQYTSADADRKVSNRYDSFSTGDKYDINSLNAFMEAKYVYSAEQNWTVEPKVRLSYYYIEQDKVNEGYIPGQISMRTDKINSNTADVEVGVDFIKSSYLNNGKLKNILSLGVINTIGDKSKELNGYILGKEKDGKKFDIQGTELPKTSGKVSLNIEYEKTNGLIYTAGVSLEFAKDYNRNINATVGIGYKF
ncbi:autotransporter outer membrane beta-barrel domain-containing protein [Fusobacterium ulcerans]|uniref:autotransporter family protein n=1 Tax=Fusobacterium ulcerans TaxID=861 RepID=UPI002E7957AA|nr:autotransporter outer membrane beta-barrel domain-containing protein [Fusobacterium ulcerans]MEE0137341.1 autotransporter outer membrane beta-barrel domain-containing protein [Fusobacterium ulcerans]